MKLARKKANKKAVEFFAVNFGFEAPIKIIVDGPFIAKCVAKNEDLVKLLTRTLSVGFEVFATPCVLAELREIAKINPKPLEVAQTLRVFECKHKQDPTTPYKCLMDISNKRNPNKFYFASGDRRLVSVISRKEICPYIEFQGPVLSVSAPNKRTMKLQQSKEQKKKQATEWEVEYVKALQRQENVVRQ